MKSAPKSDSKTILCFLDNDYGRDVEMMMPLIFFIEKSLGCEVKYAFVWDVHAIYRIKPHIVLLPNTIGSPLNFKISKYAHQNGIRVFALISEGNFRLDGTFNYWGYNTDKIFYEDYICHWSKRTLEYLGSKLPEYQAKMVLTGAVGFDRYRIFQFKAKNEFLAERNLAQYRKIVGYAGWAFGKIYNKQGRKEVRYLRKDGEERLKWMEEQMYLVESMLKSVIEQNPDILFLLKRHPNEANPAIVKESMNEMIRLQDYPNVLYIKENENIHDLLNISDLWMAFESTSTMESWVMRDNPTILLNPDPDFKRDKIYKGSVIARDYQQLQAYLDEFYETGSINAFYTDELEVNRKQLIKDTIGFDDGLNHIRAGIFFKNTYRQATNPNKVSLNLRFYVMYVLLHIGKFFYWKNLFRALPKFRKTIWIFERFKLTRIPSTKNQYWPQFERFYQQHHIVDKINQGILEQELVETDHNFKS